MRNNPMRLIDKILALFLLIFLALASAVAFSVRESAVVARMATQLEQFVGEMLRLTLYCIAGLLVLAALAGVVTIWSLISKRNAENMRQRDGSYPLQRVKIGTATVLIDVNKTLAPAIVVSPSGIAEVYTATPEMHLQHAIARSRVSVAQALAPGDNAISSRFGSQFRWPGSRSADRHLIDGKTPPLPQLAPPATPEAPAVEAPSVQRLYLRQVLERATPNQLIVGQDNDTGDLAIFDPTQSIHAGIVGATGTGKTTSAGYTLVAQALRTGYHVVIIDPKGGADWSPWATHAEWHASDPERFPAQVDALWNEHVRRIAIGGQHQPLMVVIEEYGDLISQLRRTDRKRSDDTDATLDRLMRLSRSSRIHLLMIDQYPEEWSQQVIAGCKYLVVFRLGPNQGAKVREYRADRLPDRGRFLVRDRQYDAWFAAPHLDKMLAITPPSAAPHIIDGEFTVRSQPETGESTSGEQAMNAVMNSTMNAAMNAPAPASLDDWYAWTLAEYLPAHPELLQVDAQGRGVGVRALAEAMALAARGDAREYEAFKGVASGVARRLRESVRLSSGERLGVDVARSGN